MTGAPLVYASSQFQDHTEIGSDDCPPTPGDDDDDEDDKDKVSVVSAKNAPISLALTRPWDEMFNIFR